MSRAITKARVKTKSRAKPRASRTTAVDVTVAQVNMSPDHTKQLNAFIKKNCLLSTRNAARYMGVSKNQLLCLSKIDPEFIQPIVVTPKLYRWSLPEIVDYVERKRRRLRPEVQAALQ